MPCGGGEGGEDRCSLHHSAFHLISTLIAKLRRARLCRAAGNRDGEALAVEALLHAFHLRLLGLLPVGVAIDRARPLEPIIDRRLLRLFLRALEAGTAAGERPI